MKIISERHQEEDIRYSHEFEYTNARGCGFTFPCDENGNIAELNQYARANYNDCVSGKNSELKDLGIIKHRYTYTVPAIGICEHCGKEIELIDFTNTCNCGAEYNNFGQRLAPREQWGWETGETAADLL